jgi:hypothetical protein
LSVASQMIPTRFSVISRSWAVQEASLSTSGLDDSVTCNANAIRRPRFLVGSNSDPDSRRRARAASFPDGAPAFSSAKEATDCHYVVTLPTQIFLDAIFAETAICGTSFVGMAEGDLSQWNRARRCPCARRGCEPSRNQWPGFSAIVEEGRRPHSHHFPYCARRHPMTVTALKSGAVEFFTKPIDEHLRQER